MYEIPNVIKYFDCGFRYMIQKASKSGIVLELRKVYDSSEKAISDFRVSEFAKLFQNMQKLHAVAPDLFDK